MYFCHNLNFMKRKLSFLKGDIEFSAVVIVVVVYRGNCAEYSAGKPLKGPIYLRKL